MKKHILYQRNSKGQYVCGISKTKITLLAIIAIFIGCGIAFSLSNARSANADIRLREDSKTLHQEPQTTEAIFSPCSGIKTCDLTDTETKLRIYELTEGGKKAIKWYGKTKISPVTAYTSRVQETDASPCIAADGSDICKRYANGEKICASNDYKLGSIIDVQGLGKCVVADRMNKRYTGTGRIDWYMGMDLVGARKWGLRHVAISSL